MERTARHRIYLMCPPEHFAVEYVINPWMDTNVEVSAAKAVAQWQILHDTLAGLGHEVHTLRPEVGLPDMVFAANGAFVVDGTAYGAKFKYPQRVAEAKAHRAFYEANNWKFVEPTVVNEGEGDFAYLPEAHGGLILAGYGFRTDPSAHTEAQEALSRPVISLKLVNPAFYHLDVALASLDDSNIVYYPQAFSPSSQAVLRQLFPDAVIADETDGHAFGLNLVSDGRTVVLPAEANSLAAKIKAAGYETVQVDLSELKKGGGSVKCCVAELRP